MEGAPLEPPRPSAEDLDALCERDPVLGDAIARVAPYPGFPSGALAGGSHFEAIARSVTRQQLAGAAAETIHRRACALTPGPGFPTAEECLALDETAFREAGLSGAKTRAVKDLARGCLNGGVELDDVEAMGDDEIVAMLVSVWGIGRWTAEMFLLFRLGRLDVMPANDLGVREGARILDGLEERPSAAAVLERARVWRPLRSVATWTLYRLVDEDRALARGRNG